MRKITYYLTFLSLLFLHQGCSSDQNPETEIVTDYYFRYKINGVQKDYSAFVNTESAAYWNYVDFSNNGQLHSRLSATENISYNGQRETLSIDLMLTRNIQANLDYTTSGENRITEPEVLVMGLFDADGNMFLANSYSYSHSFQSDAVVRITEITNSNIKGTFSGTLYNNSNPDETVSITDGAFYVHRAHL